jgi:hypothetical protein
MLPCGSTDEPAPLSSLLLNISIIIGSIISDLSFFTENIMIKENMIQEWLEMQGSEEMESPLYERIVALKKQLLNMYGESGKYYKEQNVFNLL